MIVFFVFNFKLVLRFFLGFYSVRLLFLSNIPWFIVFVCIWCIKKDGTAGVLVIFTQVTPEKAFIAVPALEGPTREQIRGWLEGG